MTPPPPHPTPYPTPPHAGPFFLPCLSAAATGRPVRTLTLDRCGRARLSPYYPHDPWATAELHLAAIAPWYDGECDNTFFYYQYKKIISIILYGYPHPWATAELHLAAIVPWYDGEHDRNGTIRTKSMKLAAG